MQTWAGQSFGYYSSGQLEGMEQISQSSCSNESNTCSITIPAPGVALVFLTSKAQSKASPTINTFQPQGTQDAKAVKDSNGSRGSGSRIGATSEGSVPNGGWRNGVDWGTSILMSFAGFVLILLI